MRFLSIIFSLLLVIIISSFTLVSAAGFDSNQLGRLERDSRYYRYAGGAFSLIFGTTAMIQGGDITGSESSDKERWAAYWLLAIGGMRVGDGLFQLTSKSQLEKDIVVYHSSQSRDRNMVLRDSIRRTSEMYEWLRPVRSGLIMGTAIGYYYLYFYDKDEYQILIYPALIMSGISMFQLFFDSPAERFWNKYGKEKREEISLYILPAHNGFSLGLEATF